MRATQRVCHKSKLLRSAGKDTTDLAVGTLMQMSRLTFHVGFVSDRMVERWTCADIPDRGS